jgi:hypothetical protein
LLRLGLLVGAHRAHRGLDQQTVNSKWIEGINCGQLQMLPFYLRLQNVLYRINTGINIPTPDVRYVLIKLGRHDLLVSTVRTNNECNCSRLLYIHEGQARLPKAGYPVYSIRHTDSLLSWTVPSIMRSDAGFSLQGPEFNCSAVHLGLWSK